MLSIRDDKHPVRAVGNVGAQGTAERFHGDAFAFWGHIKIHRKSAKNRNFLENQTGFPQA
jgi:uncharacterized Ntn-hydrolase superfamily protein